MRDRKVKPKQRGKLPDVLVVSYSDIMNIHVVILKRSKWTCKYDVHITEIILFHTPHPTVAKS